MRVRNTRSPSESRADRALIAETARSPTPRPRKGIRLPYSIMSILTAALTAVVAALMLIGAAQCSCLDALWQHESDWDPSAENPTSGAYGIAQALPATRMASIGEDWMSNPITQVSWGLEYIAGRYGTACNAWSFWRARYPHWY